MAQAKYNLVVQLQLGLHLFYSISEHLGVELERYVATLPVSVKVLRTGTRSGLIRARLVGAEQVTGQVITFLDAHVECTEGWLEPLLARIAEDRWVGAHIGEGHINFQLLVVSWRSLMVSWISTFFVRLKYNRLADRRDVSGSSSTRI